MGSGPHELSRQGSTCIPPRQDKGSGCANRGAGSRRRRLQTLVQGWLEKGGRGHLHGRHQMSLSGCREAAPSAWTARIRGFAWWLDCPLPRTPGSTVWLQAGALEEEIPHISSSSTAHLHPLRVLGPGVCLLVRLLILSRSHSTLLTTCGRGRGTLDLMSSIQKVHACFARPAPPQATWSLSLLPVVPGQIPGDPALPSRAALLTHSLVPGGSRLDKGHSRG